MDVRPLREWRLKRGYGLLEFARLTGLSATTVIALETGRSRGYGRTWRKAAHALGIEPEQIAEYRRAVGLEAERSATEGEGSDREA
jgi:transcriptional regulator with XRE-family HTH domain